MPSFHLAISHDRRLSCRAFPKRKKKKGRRKTFFMKLCWIPKSSVDGSSACLPILSVSSSRVSSIYFSCHVILLFSIIQSVLLVPHGTECSNLQ
jgi:hypothetical protein